MDRIGLPLYPSLYGVVKILESEGVRDRIKILAAGKLINAGRQLTAFALGADACYTARGFMLALGCIQARECGSNTCPVGITTHDPQLQAGLDPELKATRVAHYVENTQHDLKEMLVATGKCCPSELSVADLFIPSGSSLWQFVDKEPLLREALQTETESVTTPPLVES
jgi:glutamate synthase domain-containing protein 2